MDCRRRLLHANALYRSNDRLNKNNYMSTSGYNGTAAACQALLSNSSVTETSLNVPAMMNELCYRFAAGGFQIDPDGSLHARELFLDVLTIGSFGNTLIQGWANVTGNCNVAGTLTVSGNTTVANISAVTLAVSGNVGFFGVAPVARPLLATGAGHTVDDVITALQTLGLVRQS